MFPQSCPFPTGIVTPTYTLPPAKHTHHPKWHLDRFSRFVWVIYAMLYDALSMGKITPKTASSPWDFVTLQNRTKPARPQATCTKNLVEIARVVPEISLQTDRQTDRQTPKHTQTGSLQYVATAPAGEIITRSAICKIIIIIIIIRFVKRQNVKRLPWRWPYCLVERRSPDVHQSLNVLYGNM